MKPLYEIAQEYQTILDAICESDEITVEQLTLLDQYKDDFKNKVINIGSIIKNMETEKHAIEEAIDKMALRSVRLEKKIDKLKEYVKGYMEMFNIKEVKCPYFEVRVKKNPCSVNITNEMLLPEKYMKQILLKKPDKLALIKDIKNNNFIPGVILESTTRIEIN